MLHHSLEFLLASDAVYPTSVCYIVIYRHRQWAWALRYQSYVATQLYFVSTVRGHYIVVAEPYIAIYLHTLRGVDDTVEGA